MAGVGSRASVLALLPREVAAWWNDDILRLGASVAYYTLFAIAPILLIATALAGAVFGDEAVRGEIIGQMEGLVGRDGGAAVQALVEGARQPGSGALAATIVIVLLLWVYYSVQILLIGAEYTRLYTEWTTGRRPLPTALGRAS